MLSLNIAEKEEFIVGDKIYYTDGVSSLCTTKVNLGADIKIDKEEFFVDDTEFIIGKEVPITFLVENKGQLPVEKIQIEVFEGSKETGVLNNINIIDGILNPGESKIVNANFTPKETKSYNVEILATSVDETDAFIVDNKTSFTVGSSDISIDRLYASDIQNKFMLNAVLSNKSSIKSGEVTIKVKEDSVDGKVIYTKNINVLKNDNEQVELLEINEEEINFDSNGKKTLYVEIEDVLGESSIYNNSSYIVITKKYAKEDINKDGKIDIEDLANVATRYNETSETKLWDYIYDLDGDSIIDIFDLVSISRKIGI